jgi:peptidyl-tRNA hydrolase
MNKLYLVVRSNLPPGSQAVQACHALRQFIEEHPQIDRYWFDASNTIVLLEVPNKLELIRLHKKAREARIPHSVFREPDLRDDLTAIALAPSGRSLCSGLPLALRG